MRWSSPARTWSTSSAPGWWHRWQVSPYVAKTSGLISLSQFAGSRDLRVSAREPARHAGRASATAQRPARASATAGNVGEAVPPMTQRIRATAVNGYGVAVPGPTPA